MRRREFITLIGGAAAAWPLAARAQQPGGMRRIGVLMSLAEDDRQGQARLAAFVQTLRELGWTDRRNVRIDTLWATGNAADTRDYAAELVALAPDVILASGGTVVGTLIQATRTVPIVFTQTVDLGKALDGAKSETAKLFAEQRKIPADQAASLVSMLADCRITQVVDVKRGVHCIVAKDPASTRPLPPRPTAETADNFVTVARGPSMNKSVDEASWGMIELLQKASQTYLKFAGHSSGASLLVG
jgi:hypothetical protein